MVAILFFLDKMKFFSKFLAFVAFLTMFAGAQALEVDTAIQSVNVSSTVNSSWDASRIKDNDVTTAWSSNSLSVDTAPWVQANLSGTNTVNYVKIYPRKDDYLLSTVVPGGVVRQYGLSKTSGFPVDFQIQSYQGGSWVTVKSFTSFPEPGPNGYAHFSFANTYTSAIRLVTTKTVKDYLGGQYFQIGDIRVGYDNTTESKRGVSIYGDSTNWGFIWADISELGYASKLALRVQYPIGTVFSFVDRSVPGVTARDFVSPRTGMCTIKQTTEPSMCLYDARQTINPGGQYLDVWPLKTIEQHMATDPSKYVIVRLGLNDAINNSGLATFNSDIAYIVNAIKASGRTPIIAGLNKIVVKTFVGVTVTQDWVDRRNQYNDALKTYAAQQGLIFIDVDSVAFNGASDIADDVHATPEYNARIAEKILSVLNANGIVH